MLAISKASLKAIFKSPQAVFFSLFFPMVLIWIFGALSGNKSFSIDVAFDHKSDTTNTLFFVLNKIPVLNIGHGSQADLEDKLKKGRITALMQIIKKQVPGETDKYELHLKTTSAGQRDMPILQPILKQVIDSVTKRELELKGHDVPQMAVESPPYFITQEKLEGTEYKMIDFYLPGMIGFSLIGAAVFGVAFVFYSFRETLVLKRLFSTPIQRVYIVLGESIARIIFLLCTAVVLILFGTYFYHFRLANGAVTFIEMLVLCFMGIVTFMGFGYIISGIAKNQNVIPIYANLFMFPQYFLSGTFFPKSALPAGLQPIIKFLPLTALNDALRKVSFEGSHLTGVLPELAVMAGWCVVVYFIAVKVFKWE